MQFNGKNCHVLHIGKTNPKYLYHINGCLVTPVHKEKDLGVVMTRDLKASSNVNECVKRANQTLGMIKRTFSYLDGSFSSIWYEQDQNLFPKFIL